MNLIDTERRLRALDIKRIFKGLESKVPVGLLGGRHRFAIGEGRPIDFHARRKHDVVDGVNLPLFGAIDEAGTVCGGECRMGGMIKML